MTKYIINDKNFYVTDEVSSVPTDESNLNWENRYKFVTDLAAISRGKYESNNPELRFKHLLKEASGNFKPEWLEDEEGMINSKNDNKIAAASRPLEFLPVALPITNECNTKSIITVKLKDRKFPIVNYNFLKHCYVGKGFLYTNFRHLYNWFIDYESMTSEEALELIPFNTKEELKYFKAIRVSTPMFVWSQLMTHTQISKESQSDRVSKNNSYWLPEDIIDKLTHIEESKLDNEVLKEFVTGLRAVVALNNSNGNSEESIEATLNHIQWIFLNQLSQEHVQSLLKEAGYKREIFSRAPYYFKYKELIMTGWMNDPEVWGHFLLEREAYPDYHKSWVQKETADTAIAIRDVLLGK